MFPISPDGIVSLPLKSFSERFAGVLPGLIACVLSEAVRQHPRWGRFIPFDVPAYGAGSCGHIVRPDIVLTEHGPRICELDFVPSGRGWTIALLPESRRADFVSPFAHWYDSMGVRRVAYATGTDPQTGRLDMCHPETVYFGKAFSEYGGSGIKVRGVSVNQEAVEPDEMVDRLFYRVDVANLPGLGGAGIMTSEPCLDSKVIFALVHDPEMTHILEASLGAEDLAFLRKVMAETYYLPGFPEREDGENAFIDSVCNSPKLWVVKNGDVETATCWGSRGVMLGSSYGDGPFLLAVRRGIAPRGKSLGNRRVLQRRAFSLDLRPLWDADVQGQIYRSQETLVSATPDPILLVSARKHVDARVGVFFLVTNGSMPEVRVPPYGVLTLRQDPLAHGAKDAKFMAFELV